MYCTEASLKFFKLQLQKAGLSEAESQRVIGHVFITPTPPLTSKILVNDIDVIFNTLSDLNYQRTLELETLDRIRTQGDIHSALYLNSKNCIELFKNHARISHLNINSLDFTIDTDNQKVYFLIQPTIAALEHYSLQGFFYSFTSRMKELLGDLINAHNIEVAFKQKSIPDEQRFTRAVTHNIRTGHDDNYIAIPKPLANIMNRHVNPLLTPFIESQLTKEYAIRLPHDTFLAMVLEKTAILLELQREELSINTIAEAMNMSRSTLYRNLAERNITFSQIIEEKRRTLSLDLLNNTKMSVGEISDRLGYKNLSAFNRAFKRWFHDTPLSVRKKM